ncbi:MAG: NTP transferase domain-containing protein [Bacteroidales bacterium]|nr:NTP transferase domain-containing protein [Bacteroidales bacterium]
MKAMIFAAGLGTRLKPLTDTMPKALVPVGGRPLLYHVVDKLKDAGFDVFVINVHHFPDMIKEYVHEQGDFGVKVSFSDERDLLRETGGGIRHARPFLEGGPFLVHNVDILSDLDIGWFLSQAAPDALANILVSERQTQRYLLFDRGMRLVGWTNVATGEVRTPFKDLNMSDCRRLAFDGVHLISDRIFTIFDDDCWGERFSIMDFYIGECAKHRIQGIVAEDLRMMDVGKAGTLNEAEAFLSSLK